MEWEEDLYVLGSVGGNQRTRESKPTQSRGEFPYKLHSDSTHASGSKLGLWRCTAATLTLRHRSRTFNVIYLLINLLKLSVFIVFINYF